MADAPQNGDAHPMTAQTGKESDGWHSLLWTVLEYYESPLESSGLSPLRVYESYSAIGRTCTLRRAP